MKLTRKNASTLYDGLCALLGIDSLVIDHNSVLHTNHNNDNDEEKYVLYFSPYDIAIDLFFTGSLNDSKIWKEYDSQPEWSINDLISIDNFAYYMRCDPNEVKYQILKSMWQGFDSNDEHLVIEVNGKKYTINNLEELKVKADLKT